MKTEKFSRQEIIKGWEQEKLSETSICIVGEEVLSDFIFADLLAIGVNNITRIGRTDFFEFEKMKGDAEIEQINVELLNSEIARSCIPSVDFLIDAGNNPEQKNISLQYAEDKGIPFMSVSSTDRCFLFSINGNIDDTIGFHLDDYSYTREGKLNSLVCSAIAVDEFRKRIFPLEYDIEKNEYFYDGIKEGNRILEGKKFALIGAGAAGTFAGLGLAFENADASIFDFDVAEESNLSRQIFFYDAVGDYKATALSEKLKKYGGKFTGIVKKIDSDFDPSVYDAIISCVDNFHTRMILNKLAKAYNIPLVNCGVSLYEGETDGYIPGRTACLDCQMLGALSKKDEKKETSCLVQPSLIMPNQIVGGLAVEEAKKIFFGEIPEIMRYSSGEGIFHEEPKIKCLETCLLK